MSALCVHGVDLGLLIDAYDERLRRNGFGPSPDGRSVRAYSGGLPRTWSTYWVKSFDLRGKRAREHVRGRGLRGMIVTREWSAP